MNTDPSKNPQDKDIEQVMGTLLRVGVIVAAVTASIGGILYLMLHGGDQQPSYAVFKGVSAHYTSLNGVLQSIKTGDSSGIMQLGILLLIATPIARIIFSVASFIKEKDYMYVVISAIVLAIIGFSLFNGIAA